MFNIIWAVNVTKKEKMKMKIKMKLIMSGVTMIIYMLVLTGCGSSANRVLIVGIEKSIDDSMGIVLFEKALKSGGQVAITVDEIRDSDPDFESKYTLKKDGVYFTRGAVINYVSDHGWSYHTMLGGSMLFKKAQ